MQTPRSDGQASGNRLRERLQRFETLEKDVQFTSVGEDATFWRRVSTGLSYQTIPYVDDGFGDRTSSSPLPPPLAPPPSMQRIHTLLREGKNSRIYATIPGKTRIGPALQDHITQYFVINGIGNQIPTPTTKERTSWVLKSRGKNRYVKELHFNHPDHNPTSSELQEKEKLVQQRWSNRASRKLMRSSTKHRQIPCTIVQKKFFLLKKGSGMTFLPANISSRSLEIRQEIDLSL